MVDPELTVRRPAGTTMNVVVALLPPDPVTSTMNCPSCNESGKSWLMSRRTVPSEATAGLTCAVWRNV